MIEQLNKPLQEEESLLRVEDSFRRAAFNWALSTKRLVESSNGLGANTKVAHAALVDIEYARSLLEKLFVPPIAKALTLEEKDCVTKEEVQVTLSDLSSRIASAPVRNTPFNYKPALSVSARVQAHVDDIVGAPPIVRQQQAEEPVPQPLNLGTAGCWPPADGWDGQSITSKSTANNQVPIHMHQVGDLSAPVYPKNGKALWAGIDCPSCPAKATERCKKNDGTYLSKPHTKRKSDAESSVELLREVLRDANVGENQGERDLERTETSPETALEGA